MPYVLITPARNEAAFIDKTIQRDLWRYRELFYFLAWRDLLVRKK